MASSRLKSNDETVDAYNEAAVKYFGDFAKTNYDNISV